MDKIHDITAGLTLTAYCAKVAGNTPSYEQQDCEQGYWYIENDPKGIGDETTRQLHQTYIFMNLGNIAATTYLGANYDLAHHNPLIDEARGRLAGLLPTANLPLEAQRLGTLNLNVSESELGLPRLFIEPILRAPELRDYLIATWGIAKEIYHRGDLSDRTSGWDRSYFYPRNGLYHGATERAFSELDELARAIQA